MQHVEFSVGESRLRIIRRRAAHETSCGTDLIRFTIERWSAEGWLYEAYSDGNDGSLLWIFWTLA